MGRSGLEMGEGDCGQRMLPAVSVAKDVVAITPSATVAFSPLSKQCALRGFRMEKAGSWP